MFEAIKNIDDLKAAILTINVKDYGDFKRKVVLYLNRYMEEHQLTGKNKTVMSGMIDKIQFQPPTEIERARRWSLDQLNNLQ